MNKTKLIVSLFFLSTSMLLNCGCQESAETDIVVHKDMNQMLEEAKETDENKVSIDDLKEEEKNRTENYKAEISNDSLGVTVHIDAEIDIPETDKLCVFRIKKRNFTEEDVKNAKDFLIGEEQMFDFCSATVRTKSDIERDISLMRQAIEEVKSFEDYQSGDEKEYENELLRLQEEYENAPDTLKFTDYPEDMHFKSVAEMAQGNEFQSFWKWEQECGSEEVVNNITADGKTIFYAQNNADRGNKIQYVKVASDDTKVLDSMIYHISAVDGIMPTTTTKIFEKNGILTLGYDIEGLAKISDITANLSMDEAKEKADAFLSSVGLDDFAFCKGDKYNVICKPVVPYYQECYILTYYRKINGVFFNQTSGAKSSQSEKEGSFQKKDWGAEVVELYVNDKGIVEMSWNEPIEIMDTVVNNSSLKPLSEIKNTFEKMIPIKYALDDERKSEITIDKVTLSYSRISEKDDFESGLIVPVWSFWGTNSIYTNENGTPEYAVQMSINALDGSVIDSALGY